MRSEVVVPGNGRSKGSGNITGLEFQGVEHVSIAAVWMEDRCIDVRVGRRMYSDVSYP